MSTRELTCIGCPLGCMLSVDIMQDGAISVSGNACPNGERYAKKEVTDPCRIVTSTVRVEGGILECVSVKTATDIPKAKLFDCVRALKDICVLAPVQIGDVVLRDVCGTGVDVIATQQIQELV